MWLGPSHSTSLGVMSPLLVPELLQGPRHRGVAREGYRSFPKSVGKTQVRQQQTLEIPGEQAGLGLRSAVWPGQWLLLLSTGPSRGRGAWF